MHSHSFEIKTNKSIEKGIEDVTAALKVEGFGVLTRIDVKATIKEKLGEDFHPYVILGACNPQLAHRALSADSAIGIMLPCNVTVEATEDGGSLIRIANPEFMFSVGDFSNNSELQETARLATEKLHRVSQQIQI